METNKKPTIFKCLNDDCGYHKKMKSRGKPDRRVILGVGIVEGDSFIILRCKECGEDRKVNVDEKVDSKTVDIAQLLMRPRANT